MKYVLDFLKGILVGIGGIAPGLSGSVMLLILGLYEKVIGVISNPFKNFKKNIPFLIPLLLGGVCGVLVFSRIVDWMLASYAFQTRFLFLGLVIGTVPLFFKSVRKNGFRKRFYFVITGAFAGGILLFSFTGDLFAPVTDPNYLQSALLGFAVAGSSIVPGVDSAVILSALGLYELYVSSLANLNAMVLIPAVVGLVLGAVLISQVMNFFIRRFYTGTFSVIFGLFISIIPKVLNSSCAIHSIGDGALAVGLVLLGFGVSFYFGDIKKNNERIGRFFQKCKG